MKYSEDEKLNLKVFIALNRCQQSIMKRTQNTIKKHKLTLGQFAVLEMLYHKGDLKVGEIIEKSLSSIGNISLVVDNLVKLSLVKKVKSSEDKRITFVSLSPKGKELIEDIFPDHLNEIVEAMKELDHGEKKVLIELLRKLGKN